MNQISYNNINCNARRNVFVPSLAQMGGQWEGQSTNADSTNIPFTFADLVLRLNGSGKSGIFSWEATSQQKDSML